MYWPTMLLTLVNALFNPSAKLLIPAVAAKATSARINRYSTKPCPASSLWRAMREFNMVTFPFRENWIPVTPMRRHVLRRVHRLHRMWDAKQEKQSTRPIIA
jgi:hypothetical protein